MDIISEKDSLSFKFDFDTKIKHILIKNENEYTIIFESKNRNSLSPVLISNYVELPILVNIINYIKEHGYICNNYDIHIHFLGTIYKARSKNSQIYHNMTKLIRAAKKEIQNQENGSWILTGNDISSHFNIYKFIKYED